MEEAALLYESFVRHGDDRLILGHRLSEWCGHGPILEEDIALSNIGLDLLGQASSLLERAAAAVGDDSSADQLAFHRDARAFRNLILVEQPNGDFAVTMVRQYLFDVFDCLWLDALRSSEDSGLRSFAERSLKEATFHERHSRNWLLRLGDGTEESHRRCQSALDALFNLTGEFFAEDDVDRRAAAAGWFPELSSLESGWREQVSDTVREATLTLPEFQFRTAISGRGGRHSEHLDHLLDEMQVLARAHPGASW